MTLKVNVALKREERYGVKLRETLHKLEFKNKITPQPSRLMREEAQNTRSRFRLRILIVAAASTFSSLIILHALYRDHPWTHYSSIGITSA